MSNEEDINELVTKISKEVWDKFEHIFPKQKRSNETITYLVRELAIEKAKNKILMQK